MTFNSPEFAVFLPIVLLGYFLISARHWRGRKAWLLVASYAFYMSWNPGFMILLLITTLADFVLAQLIERTTSPVGRRALLLLSIGTTRDARLLQVPRVRLREHRLAVAPAARQRNGGLRRRPADRHLVLHVREPQLHDRRVSRAHRRVPEPARLLPLPRLHSTPGRGAGTTRPSTHGVSAFSATRWKVPAGRFSTCTASCSKASSAIARDTSTRRAPCTSLDCSRR